MAYVSLLHYFIGYKTGEGGLGVTAPKRRGGGAEKVTAIRELEVLTIVIGGGGGGDWARGGGGGGQQVKCRYDLWLFNIKVKVSGNKGRI